MNGTDEPGPAAGAPIAPPIVYVKEESVWEYRRLVRDLKREEAPGEDELNALGAEGWELVGVLPDPPRVHFYFKRLAD